MYVETANIEKLATAIIETKSGFYISSFAENVKGAPIKKLIKALYLLGCFDKAKFLMKKFNVSVDEICDINYGINIEKNSENRSEILDNLIKSLDKKDKNYEENLIKAQIYFEFLNKNYVTENDAIQYDLEYADYLNNEKQKVKVNK